MQEALGKYKVIVGYGIGQYYEKTKSELQKILKLDYLCDKKWESEDAPTVYDDIRIIKRKELSHLSDALIVIFSATSWGIESIKKDIGGYGIPVKHVDELVGGVKRVSGKLLKEKYPDGKYLDEKENEIYFDETVPDNLTVFFHGCKNKITLGRNISVGKLVVFMGNNGMCSIGDNSEVIEGTFFASGAGIFVGKDCLFSSEVMVRNHDSHHIFDATTHKRINYPKDIIIEDNVWVGHRATLLGGAKIGCGSVVGAGAITSGQFNDHVIVAGCPAKVVRENICWSRENTDYFNRDYLEECISQEALKYL